MSDQGENGQAERRQLVATEVEKLTKHLESVGLDQAKASVGEVLEAMLVVARTHPDEGVRTEYGAALFGLWATLGTCQGILSEMADDTPDVVH